MKRLVQPLKSFLHRLVKPSLDRVLARLRAHMALAVSDDLREIVRHVTAERIALTAELTGQIAAELAPLHRQLDDLNVCNDGLLREVVRLQREVQQLLQAVEQFSLERSASEILPGSLGDAPQLRLIDERRKRAA